MWSLVMWIATFRLHTASLNQAMRWSGYASPYKHDWGRQKTNATASQTSCYLLLSNTPVNNVTSKGVAKQLGIFS